MNEAPNFDEYKGTIKNILEQRTIIFNGVQVDLLIIFDEQDKRMGGAGITKDNHRVITLNKAAIEKLSKPETLQQLTRIVLIHELTHLANEVFVFHRIKPRARQNLIDKMEKLIKKLPDSYMHNFGNLALIKGTDRLSAVLDECIAMLSPFFLPELSGVSTSADMIALFKNLSAEQVLLLQACESVLVQNLGLREDLHSMYSEYFTNRS